MLFSLSSRALTYHQFLTLFFSSRLIDLSKNYRPLTYCLTPSSPYPQYVLERLRTPAVSLRSFLFLVLFLFLSTTLLFRLLLLFTFHSLFFPFLVLQLITPLRPIAILPFSRQHAIPKQLIHLLRFLPVYLFQRPVFPTSVIATTRSSTRPGLCRDLDDFANTTNYPIIIFPLMIPFI